MYLTLVQFAFYVAFALVESGVTNRVHRRIPVKVYIYLAFLTVATMGLSNSAVGYLNYPTQVIFKCCKLLAVMIGGIVIQGKKFSILDYLASLSMSIGLITFTLADSKVQSDFNPWGVLMISGALVADAIIGNVQEKNMRYYEASSTEMVLYCYGIGFFYILFFLLLSGQLPLAYYFSSQYPMETYGLAFLFSVTGYIGINIVLQMVKIYGALIAVIVTTARKAVTIVLSFVFFAKPFTFQYVWSGVIVLLGIYLNVHSKNRAQLDPFYRNLYVRICQRICGDSVVFRIKAPKDGLKRQPPHIV